MALLEQTLGLVTAKCGPDHPNTLSARDSLTEAYFSVGRRDEATALAAQTLQLKKSKLGEAHPSTLETMYHLADHLLGAGQQEQALPLLEKTVELRKITLGPDHPDTMSAMDVLSKLHADRHEYAAAAALLLNVSEHRPLDAWTWYRLGLMHVVSGEKEAYQRSCHELLSRYLEGAEPPFPGWELVWCCKLAPIGEEDALQVERLARESYAAAPDHQRARHELAHALYRAGKFAESLEHLQALWDSDVPGRVWSGVWLAIVHARMGNARNRRGTSTCPLKPARRHPGRLVRTPRWSTSFFDAKRNRSWILHKRSQTSHLPVTETSRFAREDDTTHNPSLRRRR